MSSSSIEINLNLEAWNLHLPLSLPSENQQTVCTPGLPEIEEKLQTVQCHNALKGIQHILCVKTRMVLFKNKNIHGQYAGTCFCAVIDCVHQHACRFADKYRSVRAAKLALSGPGNWETILQPLLDLDIWSYSDLDQLKKGLERRGMIKDDGALEFNLSDEGMYAIEGGCRIHLLPKPRSVHNGTGETRQMIP